jgi:hypothetical protein
MCCFSGNIENVYDTRIFAAVWPVADGSFRQSLVYQMGYEAKSDLAMVLPIPVAPKSGEKAVKFLNLEEHSAFFKQLARCFPQPKALAREGFGPPPPVATPTLAVEKVGSYEASFVPTIADFARLDKRFRLPDGTWESLPKYASYGFAVFKLRADATKVHPMAFHFPRVADSKGLYFPTLHIHDGKIHAKEHFDHILYCQPAPSSAKMTQWLESPGLVGSTLPTSPLQLLDLKRHLYKRTLVGELANEDVWI